MCFRRCSIIYNINAVSPEEVIDFLKFLGRFYLILLVFAFAGAYSDFTDSNHLLFNLDVANILLCIFNAFCIYYCAYNPSPRNTYMPMFSEMALGFFSIASYFLKIDFQTNSVTNSINIGVGAFALLISLSVLGSTVYILFKLRKKLLYGYVDVPLTDGYDKA